MTEIRPIHSDADYEWAFKEVARYFESEPVRGTMEGDRFAQLLKMIEAFESEHP
ncbi:transcriptional regulator [Parvibaculum sp.]|uniref:transcriptional regulator n=1 Tax=Parvibaculum sp. TaxID=2024848 RepID=UPI0034A02FF3